MTLAPALPGERAPTLGQTSQVWIPAEGPGHKLLVFLISKVKTSGPTLDDQGGTHAIGLASPWLWCSVAERSFLPFSLCTEVWLHPPDSPRVLKTLNATFPALGALEALLKPSAS